ncbi:hypothetical protein VZT92_003816 [Zoarces viviparus]|uniref:Uncharacterized protein n=1 Tax=Zoarces viviparus TaxID=48416 RepID=A0AAW1FUZ2_ZOAVI
MKLKAVEEEEETLPRAPDSLKKEQVLSCSDLAKTYEISVELVVPSEMIYHTGEQQRRKGFLKSLEVKETLHQDKHSLMWLSETEA